MQRVQRKFGKLVSKSTGDVGVAQLIEDFNHADGMLTVLIDNARAWKQAWISILTNQLGGTIEFETIYGPVVGASESGRPPAETPRHIMQRTTVLRETVEELKGDMMSELDAAEEKFIRPAMEARDHIKPLHKVIKKREDRKLDYERYQSRVDAVNNKAKRSERDERHLVRHETDLGGATVEYEAADEQLKKALPPVNAALYSLLPDLLATIVTIQHSLLAHSYTTLFNFCSEHGVPSQPQSADDIVSDFEATFTPLRQELEASFKMLQQGKAVHQPMAQTAKSRTPSFSSTTSPRRPSEQGAPLRPVSSPGPSQRNGSLAPPAPDLSSKPRIGSPSPPYPVDNKPPYPTNDSKPRISSLKTPSGSLRGSSPSDMRTPASSYRTPSPLSDNPWASTASPAVQPQPDYFSRGRIPSNGSSVVTPGGIPLPGMTKKKPPPPPPKKRLGEFVTALYDFDGQADELSFREGDKIKVIKKTQSVQDWWEGELGGRTGSFPANYVQIG